MKKTKDAVTEKDYFILFYILIGIVIFHLSISILYSSDFAISLTEFLNISNNSILLIIAFSLPLIVIGIYLIGSYRSYTHSILKFFSGLYEATFTLVYLNTLYLGVASIQKSINGIQIITSRLELLGLYLIISFGLGYITRKTTFLIIYAYKEKESENIKEEIDASEESIRLGSNEVLSLEIYTRKGEEKHVNITLVNEASWNINRVNGEGIIKITIKPKIKVNDILRVIYDDVPLIEYNLIGVLASRLVRSVFEVLIPSLGGKSIRSYEINKEEGARLKDYLEELQKYLPRNYTIHRIVKQDKGGRYISIDPVNEVPKEGVDNRYIIELTLSGREITAEKSMPVQIVKDRTSHQHDSLHKIIELIEEYERLRDDLW